MPDRIPSLTGKKKVTGAVLLRGARVQHGAGGEGQVAGKENRVAVGAFEDEAFWKKIKNSESCH